MSEWLCSARAIFCTTQDEKKYKKEYAVHEIALDCLCSKSYELADIRILSDSLLDVTSSMNTIVRAWEAFELVYDNYYGVTLAFISAARSFVLKTYGPEARSTLKYSGRS